VSLRPALAALALLLLAGCGSQANASPQSAPAAPTPTVGSIGQPVPFSAHLSQQDVAGTVTINRVSSAPAGAGDPYATYGSYLILDVTITATKGQVSTDAAEFAAKGASGHTYAALDRGSAVLAGSAQVGQISRGDVGINAPTNDGPLLVTWSFGDTTGQASAQFSVNG
jgi:hypothetical protein